MDEAGDSELLQMEACGAAPQAGLEWALSELHCLSPSEHSCIKLSHVEPCVNKAVRHLGLLRDKLAGKNGPAGNITGADVYSNKESWSRNAVAVEHSKATQSGRKDDSNLLPDQGSTTRLVSVEEDRERGGREERRQGGEGERTRDGTALPAPRLLSRRGLYVEGTAAGSVLKRPLEERRRRKEQVREGGWDGGDVVMKALDLVVRLEEDRQSALEQLAVQKSKVCEFRELLDVEGEKRLDLLSQVVQAEHEECRRDVLELKWHVSSEGRKLARKQDSLKLTADKNAALLREVTRLNETCPFLVEKLRVESENKSHIAHKQEEISDLLNQARHQLSNTEDKSHQTHARADADKLRMEQTLDEIRKRLGTARDQLMAIDEEKTLVTQKMSIARNTTADQTERAKRFDKQQSQKLMQQSSIEDRVSNLNEELTRLELEHRRLEERNAALERTRKTEYDSLSAEDSLLLSAQQEEERALRETRDGNELAEQEIDTLRENIAASKKQHLDNIKSVERAKRELVRLDQQMQVSLAQFEQVREDNIAIAEKLRDEELRSSSLEHSLKSTVETLQQQLKDETITKVDFQGKVKANEEELEQLMEEGRKRVERAEQAVQEMERQGRDETTTVSELQSVMTLHCQEEQCLDSQLTAAREDLASTESRLGERVSTLTPQEQQLRDDVQEKVVAVDALSDNIEQLRRKLEDVTKSSAMVEKLTKTTKEAAEELEVQLAELKERLAAERKEEESWKEEHRDISEFSSDAEERHKCYLEERKLHLEQCKTDLYAAVSHNSSLADGYRRLQSEFIDIKTLALRVMGQRLDLEGAVRDHGQLLAFQSRVYSAMKANYEHRGASYRSDLVEFCHHSQQNVQQLKLLRAQFDSVLSLMQQFLEHGLHKDFSSGISDSDDYDGATERGSGVSGQRDSRRQRKKTDRTVTFTLPAVS